MTRSPRRLFAVLLLVCFALLGPGCDDDEPADSADAAAITDATGTDATGTDAGSDSTQADSTDGDAGTEDMTGIDTNADASPDTNADASPDTAGDAGDDASTAACGLEERADVSVHYFNELSIGVATDGINAFVALHGDDMFGGGGNGQVGGQIVSPAGLPLGVPIDIGATGSAPHAAFDGTDYLVVWVDDDVAEDEIRARFVTAMGETSGDVFAITDTQDIEDLTGVAYGDGDFLVTYTRADADTPNVRMHGRLVDISGDEVSVGDELDISTGAGGHGLGNVTYGGGGFLVVWVDDSTDTDVRARLVLDSGLLGAEVLIASDDNARDNPVAVGGDGEDYLVVWSTETGAADSDTWDLSAHRVSSAGTLSGSEIEISAADGNQLLPFIEHDGTDYLVTWTDFGTSSGDSPTCGVDDGTCWDVWGRFVTTVGTTGDAFGISCDAGNQFASVPMLVGDHLLVIWNSALDFDGTGGDIFGANVAGE